MHYEGRRGVMAIDLSLCIVPTAVERLFDRARTDADYAGLIERIPSIIGRRRTSRHENSPVELDFQRDVLALKNHRPYTDKDIYDDGMRGSATLDWLFAKLAVTRGIRSFPHGFLRRHEEHIAKPISDLALSWVGFPVRYYDRPRLEAIFQLIEGVAFDDLMRFYDYEEMRRAGIYKLTDPQRLPFLKENVENLLALFDTAQREEDTWVLQILW